jgi:hypothetical protein
MQCTDLLFQGIVITSMSPLSMPILFIGKEDGTLCFCIDYRALNAKIAKDKFPIPVVDELLNELKGGFFTKPDLRCGYHQVFMHLDDTR